MSPKVIVIPIVAAGVAVAMFKLVSLRRAPSPQLSHAARPRVSAPHHAERSTEERLASAAGVLEGPGSTTVLPIAFWDAASEQLEDDEAPRTPRMTSLSASYDSLDPEDLGIEYLSRATEAFEVQREGVDDPAEVAADSMSMIGEATRFAAMSPDSERREEFEEAGADSSVASEERHAGDR